MHVTPRSPLVRAWNFAARVIPGRFLRPSLDVESLMKAASRRTGLSDFGPDAFETPLRRFVASLESTAHLHAFGRFYTRQVLVGQLVQRLRLEDLWQQHPEVLDERVAAPLIVIGAPRTGTSLLTNLLARDPTHRALANWETTVSQIPPEGPRSFTADPRRRTCKRFMRIQRHLAPTLAERHTFHLDGPEECTPLLMQTFSIGPLGHMYDVPDYSAWVRTQGRHEVYRHHRRLLQTLQWAYPAKRWLLKSPAHGEGVDELLSVYPKACLIRTHREPTRVVPSFASLCMAFREISSSEVDAKRLGRFVVEELASLSRALDSASQRHGSDRFFDVHYDDLMARPLTVVDGIYNHFGLELSKFARSRMQAYLEEERQRRSSHHYTLEEYGLTESFVRRAFDAPPEPVTRPQRRLLNASP